MPRTKKSTTDQSANIGYEAQLWQMADALRGSMDAGEYKHVTLGVLFLKQITEVFEEKNIGLRAEGTRGAHACERVAKGRSPAPRDAALGLVARLTDRSAWGA
jgi:type I restriction-modification system DNA methylase subunit